MKNSNDYNFGWTKPIKSPHGNYNISGGAARNVRIAQKGGIQQIIEDAVRIGVMAGVNHAVACLQTR